MPLLISPSSVIHDEAVNCEVLQVGLLDMDLANKENDDFVDWCGRKIQGDKYGGKKCSAITCVVEVLQNMVFIASASNLVTYFITLMHYPNAKAANMTTNFMGSAFILTIFGGFICDSFITRFWTFIIFCVSEILGLMMLMIQATNPSLQPAKDQKPSNSQAAFLYIGLYAVALGFGGVMASLQAHGADQLDKSNKNLISSFFNWFFFCLVTGGFLACTFMVYIEDNKGWSWGFGISIGALCLALIVFASGFFFYRHKRPTGSPLTRIFKVLRYSIQNCKSPIDQYGVDGQSHKKFRFLDKAMTNSSVSYWEVEETRTFLGLIPIFTTTIMMNCCLAQLNTFSVAQGIKMDRKLGHSFKIPPPSLSIIPQISMIFSIVIFERLKAFLLKKYSSSENNKNTSLFHPLKRIGVGLLLASVAMAVAAMVEAKRRQAAMEGHKLFVLWLGWQYLFLGLSDMLTLGGMLEFFYSEAPDTMRSMSTAFAWFSSALGFFLSSVFVQIVNAVTGSKWLGGKDLNKNRLELFYTVLCVVNFINLLIYMFFAKRY